MLPRLPFLHLYHAPINAISPLAAIIARPSRLFGGEDASAGAGGAEGGVDEFGCVVAPKVVAMDHVAILESNSEMTSLLAFHPFEPLLAAGAREFYSLYLWHVTMFC